MSRFTAVPQRGNQPGAKKTGQNAPPGILGALGAIVWPPIAPVVFEPEEKDCERRWWQLLCVLLVIPITAFWHHAVFYSPRCMLNDFGADYTPAVVAKWLSRDPSLPWGIVSSVTIYALGRRWRTVRTLAAPLFIAFLPLAIWIWDIPFSGRAVCHFGHDKRPLPILGFAMRTRYLYLLGAAAYALLLLALLARRASKRAPRAADV